MSEACADVDPIASVAWTLGAPLPSERGAILRSESAQLLDGLLKRCSRRRGAIEIALGEGLLALGLGDRLMRLKGYAGIGDYAREELGIAASTAHKMAR